MAGKNTGFTRIFCAIGYSMKGLQAAYIHEAAFRQELALCVMLAPLGAWLGNNGVERALLIGSLMLVLIVEVLNSALEAVVDRWGPEHNDFAGRAKDMGSAAVFLSDVNVMICWGLLLVPRLTG